MFTSCSKFLPSCRPLSLMGTLSAMLPDPFSSHCALSFLSPTYACALKTKSSLALLFYTFLCTISLSSFWVCFHASFLPILIFTNCVFPFSYTSLCTVSSYLSEYIKKFSSFSSFSFLLSFLIFDAFWWLYLEKISNWIFFTSSDYYIIF